MRFQMSWCLSMFRRPRPTHPPLDLQLIQKYTDQFGIAPRQSASTPAALGNLVTDIGNLQVRGASEFERFSSDWRNPVIKKDDSKNDVNKFEIEFLVHPVSVEHFKCNLSKSGKIVAVYHHTLKFFQKGEADEVSDGPRQLQKE